MFKVKPRRSLPIYLALMGAALPILGVQVAQAQDELHPDWSRVWNHDDQQREPDTMTVPANVIIPVTLDEPLSSARARVGDIVTATPVSRQDGDSEFPPGTRIGGVVSQAQSAYKSNPGVLNVDFQSALLPDGTEVPLHGYIASLDSDAVSTRDGHLIARDGSHVNAWSAVGIGGGAGFVLGRLLKTNSLIPTILGAAGGYLYSRSKSHHGEEAEINAGTAFGVRLESPVDFPDLDNYAGARLHYLETHRDYSPRAYGWNEEIVAAPRYHYYDYDYVNTCPDWVTVSRYDYYDFPIFPVFISYRHDYHRDPRWYGGNSYWDHPAFHRGPSHNTWDDHGNHNSNGHAPYPGNHDSTWNNHTYLGAGNHDTHYSGVGNHGTNRNNYPSWNGRPTTSGNYNSPAEQRNRVTTETRVGRPDSGSHYGTPDRNVPYRNLPSTKTTLPPITVDSNNRSPHIPSNWNNGSGARFDNTNRSTRDSGVSIPRPDNAISVSNSHANHDSSDRDRNSDGGGGSRGGRNYSSGDGGFRGGHDSSGGGHSGRR